MAYDLNWEKKIPPLRLKQKQIFNERFAKYKQTGLCIVAVY
jgi:hypothetical protein